MITNVRLRNFKSFVDETVPLGSFTILLGSNGAGKSNLFDALRLLRSIGEGRSVRDAIEGHALPGGTTAVVPGVRGGGQAITHFASDEAVFALSVTMAHQGDTIDYHVEVDVARYRVIHEELKSERHPGPYVYSTRPEAGPLKRSEDSPGLPARFYKRTTGLNPRREFSASDFLLTQFTSRRAESRLNEDIADYVRSELSSISPYELRPEVLRQYSPLGRFTMGEHGENFAAAVWLLNQRASTPVDYVEVPEADEEGNESVSLEPVYNAEAETRRSAFLAWLSEVTPRPIVDVLTLTSPTGDVVFAVKEEPYEQTITAPSLSDGTLRFAALTLAAVGGGGPRQTLVVEELENGINPTRLSLLTRMLEQVVQTGESASQIVASTHSPAILDYAALETTQHALVIGWDDSSQSSRVAPLSGLPGIDRVLAVGDVTLGDLQEEGWLQMAASHL